MNWDSPVITSMPSQSLGIIDSEEVRRLYWEEELSQGWIAKRFGVDRRCIGRIMRKNNIPRRSLVNAHTLFNTNRIDRLLEPMLALEERRTLILGIKNKTHKFCPRCCEVKPVKDFHKNANTHNGLLFCCKECWQGYKLGTGGGKHYYGLHKRPFVIDGKCEVCNKKLIKYCYHHWDDSKPNLGVWVCVSCDSLVEGLDEIDRNSWKVEIYCKLKKEIEESEKTYTYSGPFSPPNGVHRLFLNDKQTYKWCPHCGYMKSVEDFYTTHWTLDGLASWCKGCMRISSIGCCDGRFGRLHKRPKPNLCELCRGKAKLDYHHWDDNNRSKGIWICSIWSKNKCHHLAEAVDKLDNGSSLPKKYSELKQRIVEPETNKVLLEVVE